MLGIGVAGAPASSRRLKLFMLVTPRKLLTPAMVFIGVMSSLASDAGHVVLPPLAALLFISVGRSPIVGIAAVFAGVAAGFNANLLVTGLDPMLAGLSTTGAQFVDPGYTVNPAANWLFMIASTFMATLAGWAVTHWVVEPRFEKKSPENGGPNRDGAQGLEAQRLTTVEKRGVRLAGVVVLVSLLVVVLNVVIPGFPLHGKGVVFDRWAEAIVPLLFILFLLPGIAFGLSNATIASTKDLLETHDRIDGRHGAHHRARVLRGPVRRVLPLPQPRRDARVTEGEFLATAGLPTFLLLLAFILLTAVFNLFVGSMSGAQYALFAPIFIPMLMLVGISPEHAGRLPHRRLGHQHHHAAQRVPHHHPRLHAEARQERGMGTLIATMLPYTIALAIGWCAMLGVWLWLGIPLGIPFETGPLEYIPTAAR